MDEETAAYLKRALEAGDPLLAPRYTEIPTFMRTPYRPELAGVDIGLIGVPFDLGVTNRAGARHGPREVRNQSTFQAFQHHHSKILPFDLCRVADLGDVRIGDRYSLDRGIEEIGAFYQRVVGSGPTYISFDVDGLDPSIAPGTGTPEIGGLTAIEGQAIVRGMRGLHLVGGDVVEVAPPFDPTGNTALVGATMLFEILCVLSDSVAARRSGKRAAG